MQATCMWRVFRSLLNLCLMPGKILPSGLLRLHLQLSAGPVTSSDSLLLQGCRELNYSEFSWHLLLPPENSSLSSYPLLCLFLWFMCLALVKVTHVICCYISLTCRCSVIYHYILLKVKLDVKSAVLVWPTTQSLVLNTYTLETRWSI